MGPEHLLSWLDTPTADRGVRFAGDGDTWEFYDYATLAGLVHGARAQIDAQRRQGGTAVAIVLPTGPAFVAAFFGTLAAGLTPCPLAPPTILDAPEAYVEHLRALLAVADPALVVTNADFQPLVAAAAGAAALGHTPHVLAETSAPPAPLAPPAELGLLQFTSGSTGTPRAVRVRPRNLMANVEMARNWLGLTPADVFATWLPLHHDMGLIGCMLTPVTTGLDVWAMAPEQFIRRPDRWLACFGRHGATIGCAPTFGFAYAQRRVRDDELTGMDFSCWRAAVIAAERVDAAVMRRFIDRFEPRRLRGTVFAPAYGLAESTLAVTGCAPGRIPIAAKLDWSRLRFGEAVAVVGRAPIDDATVADGAGWVVSSGQALENVAVTITDEHGAPLGDGMLGEIVVRSPSNAAGYLSDLVPRQTRRFVGDALHTGDAGFRLGDEVFVLGRIGDSLKVRGRTVYVEDLEARLGSIPGMRGRCVVVAGRLAQGDAVIAVIERPPGEWADAAYELLAGQLGEGVHVRVLSAGRRTIARTSSGKPRRRLIWQALLEDRLAATLVAGSAGRMREAA